MTAANAVEEARQEGRELDIPYRRTLQADGSLNEKFPGGLEGHKALLEAEGFTVVQKGKRYSVPGYEDVLFEVTIAHLDGYMLTAIPAVAWLVQYLDGGIRKPGVWLQAHIVEPRRFFHDMQRMGAAIQMTGLDALME